MSAQLIDASTDKHVWAETYDRDLVDIFEVQSAIAETLAGALRAELTPDVVERIRRHPTDNVAAYDHFLRGREAFRRADGERTIAELERAIALDPDFAAAYGALAGSYVLSMYWHGASSTDVRPKATQAIQRAIELDPEKPLSWLARGLVAYHFDWEWDRAVEAFDRAIELDPEDADFQLWRGHCLGLMRRFDDAIAAFERGIEIDPHHIYNRAWIGFALVMRGDEADRAEAERIIREAIARDPSHHEAHQFLGWALLAWGRFAEAAEQFSICFGLVPSPFYTVLRAFALHADDPTYDFGPDLDQTRGPLQEMGNHAALAVIGILEGDIDGALDELDEGATKRSPIVMWSRSVSILSDALEGHPRFVAFNERIFGARA